MSIHIMFHLLSSDLKGTIGEHHLREEKLFILFFSMKGWNLHKHIYFTRSKGPLHIAKSINDGALVHSLLMKSGIHPIKLEAH